MTSVGTPPVPARRGRTRPWWLSAVQPGTVERSASVRIVRLVGVAVIAITLLVAASSVAMVLLRGDLVVLSGTIEPQSRQNQELRQAMSAARGEVRDYQLTGLATFADRFAEDRTGLANRLTALPSAFAGDHELYPLAEAESRAGLAWLNGEAVRAIAARAAEKVPEAAEGSARTAAEVAAESAAFRRFAGSADQLDQRLRQRSDQLVSRSDALLIAGIAAILVIAVLGKIMVLRPGIRALRLIGPPLQSLYGTAQAQRAGDTAARADPHHGVVEIRAVASAFNALADSNEASQLRLSADLANSRFLARLSRQVNHSLNVDEVINPSLRPVAEFFGTSAAWIRAWDGTEDRPGATHRVTYPAERDLVSPAALIGCAQHIATLAWARETSYVLGAGQLRDPDYVSAGDHAALLTHIGRVGQSSMIIVPIGCGADVLGYLALARPEGASGWSSTERDTLRRIGQMLGQAIVHARVFRREQQLVAELQDLDGHKQQFVSMVSHELRTPLAAIIGHLELVRNGDLGSMPQPMDRSMDAMARNSERLSRLIENLLVISRIESADEVAQVGVDLSELAAEVCQLHDSRTTAGTVSIRLHAPDPVPVTGNPDELERVISNLLGNAVKFSPPGGTVDVEVRIRDGQALLQVRDQGLGISEADQRQLFNRFFRAGNALQQGIPGTGLGLSIVRQIVVKHRGRISVSSALGRGSTFTVYFPTELPHEPVGAGLVAGGRV